MMDKTEIYRFLAKIQVPYEVLEHQAVYTVQDAALLETPYTDSGAKNLFLRDDKKQNYYLITLKDEKKIDLKAFSSDNHLRRLSFAGAAELEGILGLKAGAVSPFGILNDAHRQVEVFLDSDLFLGSALVGVHPNDNTATVWLKADDLLKIIRTHGNTVKIVKI